MWIGSWTAVTQTSLCHPNRRGWTYVNVLWSSSGCHDTIRSLLTLTPWKQTSTNLIDTRKCFFFLWFLNWDQNYFHSTKECSLVPVYMSVFCAGWIYGGFEGTNVYSPNYSTQGSADFIPDFIPENHRWVSGSNQNKQCICPGLTRRCRGITGLSEVLIISRFSQSHIIYEEQA